MVSSHRHAYVLSIILLKYNLYATYQYHNMAQRLFTTTVATLEAVDNVTPLQDLLVYSHQVLTYAFHHGVANEHVFITLTAWHFCSIAVLTRSPLVYCYELMPLCSAYQTWKL